MSTFVPAVRADVNEVAAILAAAFVDDPPTRWVFEDPADVPAFFRAVASDVVDSGGIVEILPRTAAWIAIPPGVTVPEHPCLGRAAEMRRLLGARHPSAAHHYLMFYGIHPDRQSTGLGGRILARLTARADRDGAAVYTEASTWRSARLKCRHGFRLLHPLRLPDGPEIYPAWRDPIHHDPHRTDTPGR